VARPEIITVARPEQTGENITNTKKYIFAIT
jgi:hypothetical protein